MKTQNQIQKPTSARTFHLKWTITPLLIEAIVLTLIAMFGDHHALKVAVVTLLVVQLVYFFLEWPKRYLWYIEDRDAFLNNVGVIPFLEEITRENAGESIEEVYVAFAKGMSGGHFFDRSTAGHIDEVMHVGAILRDTGKLRVKVKTQNAMEYFNMLPRSVRRHLDLQKDFAD